MNRITQLFETQKRNILSVYFTAGYPDIDDTQLILNAFQANGIQMAEIGIPFSDPMADGPVIQQSSFQALRNGMSLRKLFEQLKDIRSKISIPLVLMGYLNPIMQYGFEAFCRSCNEVGIDGMIIPDLPFDDYMANCKDVAERYGLHVIMLITPETSDERIRLIDNNTNGFIYMVSSVAVTGVQKRFDEARLEYFHRINAMNLKNPLMIGFGISNKATLDVTLANASGAIIGSKFIQLLGEVSPPDKAVKTLLDIMYNHG